MTDPNNPFLEPVVPNPPVMSEPVPTEEATHPTIDVIDSRAGYLAAVEALRGGTGPFAVDAERASGFRYSQRAYLIQVFRRGSGVFLFDPPAIGSFTALAQVMAGEEWILHAASQDLVCLREVGLDPERVFDTELGARLAGLPRVGLGAVVEELLGIHLAKEHSAADWSTRPLPQSWLIYAALDVELLPELRDKLGALLDEEGKGDIAKQEFEAVLSHQPVVRVEPWRRLSGLPTLRQPRNLAVARELWMARDDWARETDIAPGRLVPDQSLVAAARMLPTTKRDLANLREFTGRASRSQIDRWFDAVQRGVASTDLPSLRPPSDNLPAPRVWIDKNPEADARFKLARAAVTALSEELNIPLENLLTPDYLRRVSWAPPAEVSAESVGAALAALGARRWQVDATAQLIAEAFVDARQPPAEPGEAVS